jgi:hypothetical protein
MGKALQRIAHCANYSDKSGISQFAHYQLPSSNYREFITGYQPSQIAKPPS